MYQKGNSGNSTSFSLGNSYSAGGMVAKISISVNDLVPMLQYLLL